MELGPSPVFPFALPRILFLSQMAQLVVNIVRIMRNSDEMYSWYDIEDALRQASRLAFDVDNGLFGDKPRVEGELRIPFLGSYDSFLDS